jgi:hypothetical protein
MKGPSQWTEISAEATPWPTRVRWRLSPREWIRRPNLYYGVLLAVTVAVFVGSFAIHVRKNPLRVDEVDYFQCMQNTVKLGLPIYYAGEVVYDPSFLQHLSSQRLAGKDFDFYRFKPELGILKETFFAITDNHSRYTFGMWHPPLYIYLGGLFFCAFNPTPEDSSLVRYFNLFFTIGIFVGMALLSAEIYSQSARWVFLVALVLYALNSLAVRGATLIDYNATLGPCVAIWFVLAYLWNERRRRIHLGLVIATVLVLFTSLGIAASLLLAVGTHCLLSIRQHGSWKPLVSTLLGVALFLPVFLAFCHIFGLPFVQPFLHNMDRSGLAANSAHFGARLLTSLALVQMYSVEIGPLLIVMGGVFGARLALGKGTLQPNGRRFLPIVVVVGFFFLGSLGGTAYGFPKYIGFLLPLFFVFLAGETLSALGTSTGAWRKAIIAVGVGVTLVSGQDALASLRQRGGTLYNNGQEGLVEIAQALRLRSSADEIVLCSKDVAFFAQRKFVEWYGRHLASANSFQATVEMGRVSYLVATVEFLNALPRELVHYVSQDFVPSVQLGNFVLFQRRP